MTSPNVTEPVNQVVRKESMGLHPVTATKCVDVEGWVKLNYSSTIAQWNSLTDNYKRWFIRQVRRLESQGVKL